MRRRNTTSRSGSHEQADEAMKGKNIVFAEQLADKAAALAAQLLKR